MSFQIHTTETAPEKSKEILESVKSKLLPHQLEFRAFAAQMVSFRLIFLPPRRRALSFPFSEVVLSSGDT